MNYRNKKCKGTFRLKCYNFIFLVSIISNIWRTIWAIGSILFAATVNIESNGWEAIAILTSGGRLTSTREANSKSVNSKNSCEFGSFIEFYLDRVVARDELFLAYLPGSSFSFLLADFFELTSHVTPQPHSVQPRNFRRDQRTIWLESAVNNVIIYQW